MSAEIVLNAIQSYLSRDRWSDKKLLEICESLLRGQLVVRLGHVPQNLEDLSEKLRYTPEGIDWEMEWPPITNTCQLHLHFLEPVKTLVQGFELTGDDRALRLAVDITKSWMRYAGQAQPGSRFTWYDHCVAERAGNLIYLRETIQRSTSADSDPAFLGMVEESLVGHAAHLFEEGNYTSQNHGTMMDRSLYLIGKYLPTHASSSAWIERALARLREAFERDYTENMVNVENSSSYHLFNFDLYVGIEKSLLGQFGDTLGEEFDSKIDRAVRFLVHLSKPDHSFPMIGDGSRASLDALPRHPSYPYVESNPQLRHVLTDGLEGSPPKRLLAVYPEEGYGFVRTSWEYAKGVDRITYASFRAGRKVNNHKHADDLSFTLFSHGRDIFVDSGTFTYQPGDFRNYFLSAMAHNTVVVDGKTYPVNHGSTDDASLVDHGRLSGCAYMVGRNVAYPGVEIVRTFYFLPSGHLVIVDDVHGSIEHQYSQMFHFSHRFDTQCLLIRKDSVIASSGGLSVRVSQFVDAELFVHRGVSDVPGFGLVSEGFNVLHETTSLEYRQHGHRARFITSVDVTESGQESDFQVSIRPEFLEVLDGGREIRLPIRPLNSATNSQLSSRAPSRASSRGGGAWAHAGR